MTFRSSCPDKIANEMIKAIPNANKVAKKEK